MNKEDINEKYFINLFKGQIRKIKLSDAEREIEEAHKLITKLLFAWEKLEFDGEITEKSIKWLQRNSKI